MVLKFGHFEREIRSTFRTPKLGPAEGWRRSFGPHLLKNYELLYQAKKDKNILDIIKVRLNGLITSCVLNGLIKSCIVNAF